MRHNGMSLGKSVLGETNDEAEEREVREQTKREQEEKGRAEARLESMGEGVG